MDIFPRPADAIAGHPLLCLTTIAIGCVAVTRLARWIAQPPLPPGPRGFPVIGNLLDVPPTSAWKAFSTWSEKWGQYMTLMWAPPSTLNPNLVYRRSHINQYTGSTDDYCQLC